MTKLVRDVMQTDLPVAAPEDDVESVIRLMRTGNLPGVPVVNDGGRCVGIVTEEDLVLRDQDDDLHLPHFLEIMGGMVFLEPLKKFEDRIRKAFAQKVEDLMTADPITVSPDQTVAEAAKIISHEGHNRLPVAEHGRYLGVVTRVDVLGALVE